MTNEIVTNLPAIASTIPASVPSTVSQWWTAGGAIIAWRWLKYEVPSAFNAIQDYANTHDGGIVEKIFHKLFGKPIPPKQP